MTATSVSVPAAGRSHAVVLVSNADLARAIGLIEGLGHLTGGTIKPTVETITLVYPGAMLPVWTSVSFISGAGAGGLTRPNHLVRPSSDANSVVYTSESLFERICGTVSGFFCAMVPLACTTLTLVGETEGLPDWSAGSPEGPTLLSQPAGGSFRASPKYPPGIKLPAHLDDARTDILYPALCPETPRPADDQPEGSDVSDSASIVSNHSFSDVSSMSIPGPVIALPNHPSEQLMDRQPLAEQPALEMGAEQDKENQGPERESTPVDDLKAVPCHQCGAIVQIYRRRTWYAVIRGLQVGVRHTWKNTRPLVEHDRYNLSGIVHFAFHTKEEAQEKFFAELTKGNVKVLVLSEVARPKK